MTAWDRLREWLRKLWSRIKKLARDVFRWLGRVWAGLLDWFRRLWCKMKGIHLRYNPAKGWAGQTLADLVNTLAVVMGLGGAPELSDAFAWFWAGSIVAGLLTLVVAFFQWRIARREGSPKTWYLLTLATTIVGLFTIVASLVAMIMGAINPHDPGVVASIVGWPAYIAWIAAELVNVYDKVTVRPKTGPSITSLIKSLCQIVGALLIWIFVILVPTSDPTLIRWLFWTGASLALLGTGLGVVAGLWNQQRK